MTDQLILIDIEEVPPVWQLDARTCELGRRGVARARAALRAAGGTGTVPDGDLPAAA